MEDKLKLELADLMAALKRQLDQLIKSDLKAHQIEIDIIRDTLRKLYDKVVFNDELLIAENQQIESESISAKIDEEEEYLIDNSEIEFKLLFDDVRPKPAEIDFSPSLFHAEETLSPEKTLDELTLESELEEGNGEFVIDGGIWEKEIEIEAQVSNLFVVETSNNQENSLSEKIETVNVDPQNIVPDTEITLETKPAKPLEVDIFSVSKPVVKIQDRTLGENIVKNPIDSLKKYIGINDKFQFINELFDGKMKIYNDFITEIDDVATIEEALNLIEPMKISFKWDEESKVFEQFTNYLYRRYSNR
jgi:hypothetical protein